MAVNNFEINTQLGRLVASHRLFSTYWWTWRNKL